MTLQCKSIEFCYYWNMKKKFLITVSVLLILCIGFAAFWYFTYLYKYNQVVEFRNDRNQDVYILGTYHSQHFNSYMNYSMADIVNCIKNVDPDVVLIESREDTYNEYGVVDGPIDMILAYSYCVQEGIDVGMIDYWKIDNDTRPNTTDKNRDDIIHANILEKLDSTDEGCRVMIICGDTHLHEQTKRFKSDGYEWVTIQDRRSLFEAQGEFQYPSAMAAVIEDKIEYASTILVDEINSNVTDDSVREEWLNTSAGLADTLRRQLELVEDNGLYYT